MLLTAILALTAFLPAAERGIEAGRLRASEIVRALALPAPAPEPPATFSLEARAVSNWRVEAGRALRPASLALVVRHAASDPAFVARCVRLNNYWCIKSARWNGEIGADAEGHTGFADADAGADAAVQLLRRYYRDLGRRSALAIVRRWAPAECRMPGAPPGAGAVSAEVAPLGMRRNLRARYLARNTRAGIPRRPAGAAPGSLRVQPWSARALMARTGKPAPRVAVASAAREAPAEAPAQPRNPGLLVRPSVILVKPSVLLVRPSELLVKPSAPAGPATGIASAKARPESTAAARPGRGAAPQVSGNLADRLAAESAALPSLAASLSGIPLLDLRVPAPLCTGDETRIRNYAGRIAASVGVGPDDDLALFRPDGQPSANLAPVLLAMSAVELGTLRASPALVEAAIARLAAPSTPAAGP